MTTAEFERIVERAIQSIPARYRKRIRNLVFTVERDSPRSGLLGLYEGRPLIERSVHDQFQLPDKITIYQLPHERLARGREHLEQMVKDTVWHEIAHHFGLNEREVRTAERRRAEERHRASRK
jgi:predicted Zn-dependent protease with MMP-like domain